MHIRPCCLFYSHAKKSVLVWSLWRSPIIAVCLRSYLKPHLFRFRSQSVNHLRVRNNANCPLCPCTEESVAHHLYDCPALGDLRAEYLPLNPDPQNTLYGEGEQLKLTCKYHVMANGRRAQAHWPLDQLNKGITLRIFILIILASQVSNKKRFVKKKQC